MLLIEADDKERERLSEALLAVAGVSFRAVARIVDVERWPHNEIVIVDADMFTPFWLEVGASHVIVRCETPEEGAAACARGATTWVPIECDGATLVRVIDALDVLDLADAQVRSAQARAQQLRGRAPSLSEPMSDDWE